MATAGVKRRATALEQPCSVRTKIARIDGTLRTTAACKPQVPTVLHQVSKKSDVVKNKLLDEDSILMIESHDQIEFQSSASGKYRGVSQEMATKIRSYLKRGLKAFWLHSRASGSSYFFDFETMQQHNLNTGFRRSIRFSKQDFFRVERTGDFDGLSRNVSNDSVDSCSHFSQTPSVTTETEGCASKSETKQEEEEEHGEHHQHKQHEQHLVNVCGPAFEAEWLCGPMANRKLAEIRQFHVQQSPLVSEMSRLPENEQLFDPIPIPPNDSRFPIEQIKHLRFGALTVHAVRPTRMWRRNRSYFDLLHQEEIDFFSIYKQPGKHLKLKHFAWHGAPAKNIKGILECGFLSTPSARVGRCYGHGVYLSAISKANYSKKDRFSVPDAKGFKYILLCEVLPGTVEVSKRDQTHPSNKLSHTGVDRMPDPTMHIFYSYDMNVRISPKFVVCIHPKLTTDILTKIPNE